MVPAAIWFMPPPRWQKLSGHIGVYRVTRNRAAPVIAVNHQDATRPRWRVSTRV